MTRFDLQSQLIRHATTLACALAAVTAAAPVSAQPAVTPFFAIGDDLAPGGGGAIAFAWTPALSVEVEASLGTDAARSSVSLLYDLPRLGRVTPYAAAGIGVQRDEVQSTFTATGLLEHMKKTEFAVNIGAGVTIQTGSRWSYRADFRWYNPDNEWPESWRVFSGVTLAVGRSAGG
jgi:hypothetical protein